MKDYIIEIFWSQEDNCYIANIPKLEFCSAFGKTMEEALKEIQIAFKAYKEEK